jgi:hypothetical protein
MKYIFFACIDIVIDNFSMLSNNSYLQYSMDPQIEG